MIFFIFFDFRSVTYVSHHVRKFLEKEKSLKWFAPREA